MRLLFHFGKGLAFQPYLYQTSAQVLYFGNFSLSVGSAKLRFYILFHHNLSSFMYNSYTIYPKTAKSNTHHIPKDTVRGITFAFLRIGKIIMTPTTIITIINTLFVVKLAVYFYSNLFQYCVLSGIDCL